MITLVGYVRSWGLRTEQGPIPQWGKKSHNSPFCLWFLWALEFHWCLAHLGCPGGAARGEHSGPELMCSGRGVPARWSLHHTRVNWPILVTTVHRAEHILYRYGHCKKFQAHTSAQSLPQTRRARESYKAVPDSPPPGNLTKSLRSRVTPEKQLLPSGLGSQETLFLPTKRKQVTETHQTQILLNRTIHSHRNP